MKTILFCFSLYLVSLSAYSQKIIISGEETNRKLAWSDFTGKVDKSDPFSAFTYYNIRPKMDNIMVRGDSLSIGKIEVVVELDPVKSWAKKDKLTDYLLTHEQGHFDLGILCMREALFKLKQAKFTKANISSLAQSIVSDVQKKYSDMSVQYDAETQHSGNKEQQARWNTLLSEMLNK